MRGVFDRLGVIAAGACVLSIIVGAVSPTAGKLLALLYFLLLGIGCTFFPKRIQQYALAQRPPNWKGIPGLSLFVAWFDSPYYVPVVFLIGLVSLAIGLFLLIGFVSTMAVK